MANYGERTYCICKKEIYIKIYRNKESICNLNYIYECSYKSPYYKVYLNEFILNCTKEMFENHFKLLKNRKNINIDMKKFNK